MLYQEAIYNIREKLRQLIDDSDIDDREILFELNNQRSLFYRNEYNKRNRVIDEEIKQTLCVPVQLVDDDECCSDTDCTILRSVDPLPDTIELHHKNAILSVSSTTIGDIPFSLVTYNQFPYSGNGKYSKSQIFVSQHNGYLYFKTFNNLHKLLEKISVTVILENPLDIQDWLDCKGDDCFDETIFEYPIKGYSYAYVVPQVLNAFIAKLNIPEDRVNNAEDI